MFNLFLPLGGHRFRRPRAQLSFHMLGDLTVDGGLPVCGSLKACRPTRERGDGGFDALSTGS